MLIDDMMLQEPSSSDAGKTNRRSTRSKSRFHEDDEGFADLERQVNRKP
jgi:hypothetical protein